MAEAENTDSEDKGTEEATQAVENDAQGGEDAHEGQKPNGEDKGTQEAGNGKDKAWYDGIEDEKALEFAKRNPSLSDFASEALSLRQKVSQAVVQPGKDATEEDVAAYHKKIGVPEAPEGYEIKLPDGVNEKFAPSEDNKEVTEAFQQTFHSLKISKEQAAGLTEFYYKTVAAQDEAHEKELNKAAEKQIEALRKEWGGDFKRNAEVSVRAAEVFGGDDLVELFETAVIDGIPMGDHPTITKAFAKIGLQMQEADPLLGTSQDERDTLEEQHADLTKQMMEAHDKGDRAQAKRLEDRRSKITEKIAGNVPIVGAAGRSV